MNALLLELSPQQSEWPHVENGSAVIPSRQNRRSKSALEKSAKRSVTCNSNSGSLREENETLPAVAVKLESYKVFYRMFSGTESNGTTKWRQFLGAIVDVGFSVTPRGGSVENFDNGKGRSTFTNLVQSGSRPRTRSLRWGRGWRSISAGRERLSSRRR
jgi:hypothetical protein